MEKIQVRIKTVLIGITILACGILYGFFAIKKDAGPEFAVSIDLARPIAIEWPCEISIIGDAGEKGLRIAPKVGRGWRGEAGGKANYRFFIPRDGQYHIWAYALWFDECANAVFAQIDNQDKAIVGNNPVYNQWHWVRGFDINLKKGTHNLALSNHSDNIALQKIVFSSSPAAGPEQTGIVFSDIFYDGFDGCDQGNFTNWKIYSGQWNVEHRPEVKNTLENALIGKSETETLIGYKGNDWSNYSLSLSVKSVSVTDPNIDLSIYYGMNDDRNCFKITFQIMKDSKKATLSVYAGDNGPEAAIAANAAVPWEDNNWYMINISNYISNIKISIDGKEYLAFPSTSSLNGGVGLHIAGNAEIHYDDIHIRGTQIND
jgi:hypothetical protein